MSISEGISVASMTSWAAATPSERAKPLAITQVTFTILWRFFLEICGGVEDSTTVPRSLTRTAWPILLYMTMFSMSSMLVRNSGAYLTRMSYSSPSSRK